MNQIKQQFTILFADVAGSTSLYERLGDDRANFIIGDTIDMMSAIVRKNNGIVIKTIGDEIMTRFDQTNDALTTACLIQEQLEHKHPTDGIRIAVRIGIHTGPALLQDDGDLFGDAVNVAARMAGIARGKQIIISDETASNLNDNLKGKCREYDRTIVKGKSEEVLIYEVVWEPNDVTRMTTLNNFFPQNQDKSSLKLFYQGEEDNLTKDLGTFMIGRGVQCDLVINSRNASRCHAKIEYRRGKFILIDESTNGTFVHTDEGKEIYLRREEIALSGEGKISLGERIEKNNDLVSYKI